MNLDQSLIKEVNIIVQKAGKIIMSHWGKPLNFHYKPNAGFSTPADIESENFIIEELKKIDSTIPFWAEEAGKSQDNSDWYWVIDPLDGTTNFAHNIAYFCISIALTYKSVPQLGVIYDPLHDELFIAYKDCGATMNGKSIKVNSLSLEHAIVAISLPYVCSTNFNDCFKHIIKVTNSVADVRFMGSTALDLAYVAAGRFDGTFFQELKWWDVAAGVIILQEAGALVSDFEKKPINDQFQTFLAASPKVYDKIMNLL